MREYNCTPLQPTLKTLPTHSATAYAYNYTVYAPWDLYHLRAR